MMEHRQPQEGITADSGKLSHRPDSLLDGLLEGCQAIDSEYRYTYLNNTAARHGRTQPERLIGRTMMEAYPGIEGTEMFSTLRQCMEERTPQKIENEFTFPDGSKGWFELRFEPVQDGALILSVEITERKLAELERQRSHRALSALCECNSALAHAGDEATLLRAVCRALVGEERYHEAWFVKLGDDPRGQPELVAHADSARHQHVGLGSAWDGSEHPDHPFHEVLQRRRATTCRAEAGEPMFAPWRTDPIERRPAACIALPVGGESTLHGVLVIYASDPGAFDPVESQLLAQMAVDLGHGIESLSDRERLRVAHEHLDAVVRESPAAIFSHSLDGRVLTWNPGAERIFGWSARETIGRTIQMVPDHALEEAANLRNRVLTGTPFTDVEAERLRRDGSCVWVNVSAAPLRDRLGRVNGVMTIALDISSRRQVEQTLQASDQRYRALVGNLEDIVFSADTEGRIEFMGPAVERVYGFRPDEVVGRLYSDFVHPDDQAEFAASLERTLSGIVESFEFRGFDAAGAMHHFRVRSRRRTRDGRAVGVDGVMVEVTDLRRAESERHEAERKHASLVRNLPGMAYRCRNDAHWTMEVIGGGCTELTGFSAQDLIGNARIAYAEVIHPDDRQRVFEEVKLAVDAGKRFVSEYRIQTATGDVRWVWEKAAPVTDSTGSVVAREGFITDVTSRKRAEHRVRALNERLAHLAHVVQELSSARSIDDIVAVVRRAARELAAADGATFVLRDGGECHYVDEDAIAPLWKGRRFPLSSCISGWSMLHRQAVTIEDIYDDERIPHDAYRMTFVKSLTMVPVRSQAPVGAIGVYWADHHVSSSDDVQILQALADSTSVAMENVRAIEALAEERARVRAIYDHLPSPTLLWKRNEGGFVLADFNQAAEVETNGAVARLLGSSPAALGRQLACVSEDLQACFEGQRTQRRALQAPLPGSPQVRYLMLTCGLVPADTVILHIEDVTEQRHTEDQLRASQKLEAIGRLAGGIAHDLNNVLSVIISYADFAINELPEQDPVRDDVTEIQQAGYRAADLTRQLLAFSRRQVLEPEVLLLNDVISEMERMLRRLLGEDIEIMVDCAADLGHIEADPGQVGQVILNLAVNARDAMPRGGRMTIETSNVVLDEEYARQRVGVEPGRYVMLAITDTGFGMSQEVRAQIFEPFFTTKEQGKGTGLGLSTVYGIVKQSGGNIWVYSEPDQGTTFKVYLPEVDAPVSQRARSQAPAHITGDEFILVIEDEDAVRKVAERILRGLGYRVRSAGSAGDALLLWEEIGDEIDLILTDVVMPRMSGREIVDRVRSKRPDVSVLYMSGYADSAIVQHGVLEPGTPFIGKPFSAEDLGRKVREALRANAITRDHQAEKAGS